MRLKSAVPAAAPRQGTFRAVTLGDSLAYGAGDETGKGLAGRLEQELQLAGLPQVEMTNLGVNGAQTTEVLARLRQESTRKRVVSADVIVLSIGANDLFRSPGARDETLRAPLVVAERILTRLTEIVSALHSINPRARILILGGYNPVPRHSYAPMIVKYLGMWDAALASNFEDDPLVTVVSMYDIVTADRLSRFDSFHPGGAAYQAAAERMAEMLVQRNGGRRGTGDSNAKTPVPVN